MQDFRRAGLEINSGKYIWKYNIDEANLFIKTKEFASIVKNSDNYFVLITRENLHNLPYSVEEIYRLHSSGKYQNTRKVYQEMYQIYSDMSGTIVSPEKILVEDTNSEYDFFSSVCKENGIECMSTGGKTKIYAALQNDCTKTTTSERKNLWIK